MPTESATIAGGGDDDDDDDDDANDDDDDDETPQPALLASEPVSGLVVVPSKRDVLPGWFSAVPTAGRRGVASACLLCGFRKRPPSGTGCGWQVEPRAVLRI